jgi:hypothetical protein
MSSAGLDDVFRAQKRLNDVRQATNDPKQIAMAAQALEDAKTRAGQLAKMARGNK